MAEQIDGIKTDTAHREKAAAEEKNRIVFAFGFGTGRADSANFCRIGQVSGKNSRLFLF